MNDKKIIQNYITTRGLKKTTAKTYKAVLNHYRQFQGETLTNLLQEADTEEIQRIRWKHRQLKQRLTQYTQHCQTTMNITSAKTYLTCVKMFYRHHEIEIGYIPPLNKRNGEINNPITYTDLPDKEIIRMAIEISNPLMRALILFLTSTGMSRVDCLNLQVNDFITATQDFHTGETITDIIEELNQTRDVIPTFKARRAKTNKYFITFCTPETVREICNYLKHRNSKKQLHRWDKLFKINNDWYTVKFKQINDALGLGKRGSYARFRGHMLRKFHASNLKKAGMDTYSVNVLQGKSHGRVDDVYFFEDEDKLKEDYVKYMHALVILSDVATVDAYSPDYLELLEENKQLKKDIERIKQLEEDIQNIKRWWITD